MNKLRVNRILMSVCACWASISGELGLPLSGRLRLMDSITLVWSFLILCTSLAKYLAEDLSLDLTRGANFSSRSEPTMHDLLAINYLPRINEFSKLYYGLVSVSIGTSFFWRLYLRFYRPRFAETATNKGDKKSRSGAMARVMRFFYRGPPIVVAAAAAQRATKSAVEESPEMAEAEPKVGSTKKKSSAESSSILSSVAHLEWLKLFECRAVIKDLASCSEELVRSFRLDSNETVFVRRLHPLSTSHGTNMIRRKLNVLLENSGGGIEGGVGARLKDTPALLTEPDIFLNPVRSYNFMRDHSWLRWHCISRNLKYMLLFIGSMTVPILYFTIVGLYSVMRSFSYETLDTSLKLSLYCYGVMEQVYSCTQAALFFIFTNIFITIFHADIQHKINTIERDLREIYRAIQEGGHQQQHQERLGPASAHTNSTASDQGASTSTTRPPKILIYYQQFRLWAFFDHIGQVDNFVSKYSVVSMSIFMSGLSFGYSFLKVEELALKRGTAAVLVANMVSFSFLYVISWDIERRSGRLHATLLSIAARECDVLIKRLWLKTLVGFFERDSRRTFTLADRYPLNLHSYLRTVLGWFGMSLLIFRLFHKPLWDSTFGG